MPSIISIFLRRNIRLSPTFRIITFMSHELWIQISGNPSFKFTKPFYQTIKSYFISEIPSFFFNFGKYTVFYSGLFNSQEQEVCRKIGIKSSKLMLVMRFTIFVLEKSLT